MEIVNAAPKVTNFMMDRIFFLFMMLLSISTFSQRQTEKEELYQNAYSNLYSNPEKTITISEYLISNAVSTEEKAKALNLKAETLILQGKYVVALNTLLEAINLNKNENSQELIFTHLILSDLYRQLGVISKSEERLNLAQELINNQDAENASLTIYYSNVKSALFSEKQKYKEAIKVFDPDLLYKFSKQFPYSVSKSYNQLARAYLSDLQIDSSLFYSEKSLELAKESGLDDNFIVYAELEFAKANFLKKEKQIYLSSIPLLLNSSEKVPDNLLKRNIHQFLAEVYNSQGDNANYQLHNLKYLELNESVNSAQQKARDLILSLNDSNMDSRETKNFNPNYILAGILILAVVLLSLVFWYRFQTKQKYNYYTEYIRKLKTKSQTEAPFIPENTAVEVSKTNQIIPEKTEQILLEKLLKFESGTDFTQKNMTLNSLAKDLDTNTRYLSEIVNKHKHKNFNTYINELRVNYIIEKLRTEPKFLNYKISYLAEECGFSSHTAFSTVFKSVTEISPKEFITFIKKESLAVSA